MPLLRGGRPLKRWHYVGVYDPALMLCAATVRVGPARQSFWAVWTPGHCRMRQRTRLLRSGVVRIDDRQLCVGDGDVRVDLILDDGAAVEVVSAHGSEYAWTRKRGGVRARGVVRLGEDVHRIDARALIDESAGYHARVTAWEWTAGVGVSTADERLAWNLVAGIHDAEKASERTVWVDGTPREVGRTRFAEDLSAIHGSGGEELRFEQQAELRRDHNLFVMRSSYQQPFGRFSGTLPGGVDLVEGWGVIERHDVRW